MCTFKTLEEISQQKPMTTLLRLENVPGVFELESNLCITNKFNFFKDKLLIYSNTYFE